MIRPCQDLLPNPQHLADFGGGSLTVLFRCVFELRWLALLALSGLNIMGAMRASADAAHCRMDTVSMCGQQHPCPERLICVALAKEELEPTMGLRLTDHVEQFALVCLSLLLLINLGAVLSGIHQSLADETWVQEWRTLGQNSDVALCHRINQMYNRRGFLVVRFINLALLLVANLFGAVVALRRGTFLDVYTWQNPSFISLISMWLAAYKLWLPEPQIAEAPFHIYAKRMPPDDWFHPADYLSSAPTLLLAKLTVHATEEEYQEMKEELGA